MSGMEKISYVFSDIIRAGPVPYITGTESRAFSLTLCRLLPMAAKRLFLKAQKKHCADRVRIIKAAK